MTLNKSEVKKSLRAFLFTEKNQLEADDNTPILDQGILDSVTLVKLISFLESTYSISLGPNDITPASLGSIELISSLVLTKVERN